MDLSLNSLFCCHFKILHFKSAPYLYLESLAKHAVPSLLILIWQHTYFYKILTIYVAYIAWSAVSFLHLTGKIYSISEWPLVFASDGKKKRESAPEILVDFS